VDSSAGAKRARVGRWLLALTILASALLLGSLHTPVLAAIAVLAAVSMGLLWYEAEPFLARPACTMLVMSGLGLVAYTGFQALPLPHSVVALLSPETADVWARALSPMHEPGPSLVTLSLDPIATRVQVLRGVTYLMAFLAAVRVAYRTEGVVFLERVLVVCGIAMAVAALAHPVFGATKVFGTYEPADPWAYDPRHIAPLLNSNHLAGYVNIGLMVSLAASLVRRGSIPRPIAVVAALILIATNFWGASRGGTGAMVFGILATFAATLLVRRSERSYSLTRLAPFAVMIGAGLIIGLSGAEHAKNELGSTDLSKLGLFAMAARLLPRFGLFGVGRGAFDPVFPSVREGTEHWLWTHPENVVLQWTTEWGLPVALASLGVLAWALRPRTMLTRSRPPIGAWMALVVLALHNLVDFSSEVPGVVLALAVCAAVVASGTGGASAARRVDRWPSRPDMLVLGGAIATTAGIALTLPWSSVELDAERRAFHKLAVDSRVDGAAFRERLRDAILRHPADAYFPFLGGLRALDGGDSPIPWAARALERSPVYGRAHFVLARALYRRNPSQARLEYRLACDQEQALTRLAVKDALPLVASFEDAMDLIPLSSRGISMREALAPALSDRLPSTSARLDRDLVRLDPRSIGAQRRIARATLLDLSNDEPWCVDRKVECLEEGKGAALQIRSLSPESCEGEVLLAELVAASGDPEAALAGLERAAELSADAGTCLRAIVRLSASAQRTARADAALDRLIQLGCTSPAQCADNFAFAAQTELGRGNARRAFGLYKRAAERDPTRDGFLQRVAELASAQGLHGEAFDAYTKLSQRDPGESRWAAAAESERKKLRPEIRAIGSGD
jgi:tetratricopeptide (TPR) repeat protein